jgi:hypothetical protein
MIRPILAVDPGPTLSAWVVLRGEVVEDFGHDENEPVRARLGRWAGALAIEMIASYGMGVGAEVFDTCVWIGRFDPESRAQLVNRVNVKLHHCRLARTKDGNVRLALIDRWGGKAKAVGKKRNPGPLYGISGDVWQALALAVYVRDTWL